MITNEEKSIIIKYANNYKVSKVILFGSSLYKNDYNDIDIGVKGIAPELFFEFYGKLIIALSKPVDIISLDDKTMFNDLVEKEGYIIYE